jgi:phage-related protein
MKSIFTFAGQASCDFFITIESIPPYISGERIVDKYQIAGRSGDLTQDTGAFSNYTQPYEVWFKPPHGKTAQMQAQQVLNWLQGERGYQRLEDSYNPNIYRMAIFANPAEFTDWFFKYGRGTLEFDCKPQKWLKTGEHELTIANGQNLYNEWQPALPLIQITGSGVGTLEIGSYTVGISSIPVDGLTIDCDSQNAYTGLTNQNNLVTVPDGFPVLERGENVISYSGGITSVKIIPRWWIV